MNALELLKRDHERVRELFQQAEGADQKMRKKIFKHLKKEFKTHTRIEEAVFYPAMERHEQLKDMVLEARKEHNHVKTLLKEMEGLVSDREKFEPKLKLLRETVDHHAVEEEEGKMFPLARELMDEAALEELGRELEAGKEKKRAKAA